MNDLVARAAAAQAVVDHYLGRPFHWGRSDCVRLAAMALRKRHHRVSLIKAGDYSSLRGALKALKRAGFDSLEAAVEAQGLMSIPPAAALPCDLIGIPPAEPGPWLALSIAIGNGRVLGFQEGFCKVLQPRFDPANPVRAWRV